MGGSYWSYTVAHGDSIERAFIELRADVFAKGDYDDAGTGKKHASIEELLDAVSEEGTHSILDMLRVVDAPAPPKPTLEELHARLAAAILGGATDHVHGTVYRMTDEELMTCFGSLRPVDGQTAQMLGMELLTGRWTVIYKDDAPDMFIFLGVSGD